MHELLNTQIEEISKINIIKPISKIDTTKSSYKINTIKHDNCNHVRILCSHPTIPYTGLFCEKCHIEKRN